MIDRILVVTKRVGQKPTTELIDPTLEALQASVGGLIERIDLGRVTIPEADLVVFVDVYANEEARMLALPANMYMPSIRQVVLGDIVWVAHDGQGDLVSMPEVVADAIVGMVRTFSPTADHEGLLS